MGVTLKECKAAEAERRRAIAQGVGDTAHLRAVSEVDAECLDLV